MNSRVIGMNNPFVSVVVPVLNMDRTVGLTLGSLLAQTYENREVIIVDGGSTDKTKDIVKKFPVELLESGKKSIPYQRNLGIDHSAGEIIAFTDADCIADKNWLTYLVQNYFQDSIVACGGTVLPYAAPEAGYKPQTFMERFTLKEFVGPDVCFDRGKPMKLEGGGFLSGCIFGGNSSYRRSFLDKIGGLDNSMGIGEDVDSCHRIHKMGLTIMYDPRAIVYHRAKRTINSSMAQYYRYGKARAPIYKKYSTKKFFIDNEFDYYQNLYFNAFSFLKRLATAYSKEDKELYIFTPLIRFLLISSMTVGKIKGSTEHGILTL